MPWEVPSDELSHEPVRLDIGQRNQLVTILQPRVEGPVAQRDEQRTGFDHGTASQGVRTVHHPLHHDIMLNPTQFRTA